MAPDQYGLALSIKGLTKLNTIVTLAASTLIKLFVKKMLEFSKNTFFQECEGK